MIIGNRLLNLESRVSPCGCREMVNIGEDRSERLNIMPTQVRVIVAVRPRYAFGICEHGVVHRSGQSARPSEDLPLRRVGPCS